VGGVSRGEGEFAEEHHVVGVRVWPEARSGQHLSNGCGQPNVRLDVDEDWEVVGEADELRAQLPDCPLRGVLEGIHLAMVDHRDIFA